MDSNGRRWKTTQRTHILVWLDGQWLTSAIPKLRTLLCFWLFPPLLFCVFVEATLFSYPRNITTMAQDSPPGFLQNVLTRVVAALTVSFALWFTRWAVQIWAWYRLVYFSFGLSLRILLVVWIARLCFGQPLDNCLPGCACVGQDRMDCSDQRFDRFPWRPTLHLPTAINFGGSQGPWRRLPCYPFRDVRWISFARTEFYCPQALKWVERCHLRVSASIS